LKQLESRACRSASLVQDGGRQTTCHPAFPDGPGQVNHRSLRNHPN
jgi:hypothetical protein